MPDQLSPYVQLFFMEEWMERRLFSGKEKTALYFRANGKCSKCGKELQKGWHADHVQPYSKGGETDVLNGQALCAECNLHKGGTGMTVRKWQADFWGEIETFTGTSYLLVACPASGKTYAAARFAADNMGTRFDKVLVIVPGLNVKKHWAQTAHKAGLSLDSDFVNGGPLRDDMDGLITTYASLASNRLIYKNRMNRGRWLLIADECHHTGTHSDSTWGDALKEIGDVAIFRLLLSGTPFRTDQRQIPFVKYEGDIAILDFEYEYHQALADRVVRPVFFRYYKGDIAWEEPDRGRVDVSFDDELKDEDENKRLSTALRILEPGRLASQMMQDAHTELMDIRDTNPTAAGMVLCIDQAHAQKVAEKIGQWIGIHPVVAISDDMDAQEKIEAFRNGTDPWLVSVQMVSEGTDIPRLQIGVYLTTTKTELFWRQAVGRFIRAEKGGDASIYLPGDPRLKSLADHYTRRVDAFLREESDALKKWEKEDEGERQETLWFGLDAIGSMEGTIFAEERFDTALLEEIRAEFGSAIPPEKLAAFIRKKQTQAPPPIIHKEHIEPTLADKIKKLKESNSIYARRIARKYDIENREVNAKLNLKVGISSVNGDDATMSKLEARLRVAVNVYETGQWY